MSEPQSNPNEYVQTQVLAVRDETPRIRSFTLGCDDDWTLPPFQAGAHIDVRLPSGRLNQYSICSDPADRQRYRLAVLREEEGRGGSVEMHRDLAVGAMIGVSLPRNNFPLAGDASRHVLIAGGVGITPFLSMIPTLERMGHAWELHYCSRRRAEAAFLDYLESPQRTGKVTLYHDDTQRLDLGSLLAVRHGQAHAYCCGPTAMIDAFFDSSTHWPDEAVHHELFGALAPVQGAEAYTIRLAQSGVVIEVAAGQSMADALKANNLPVKTGCEAGICGVCKVGYTAGEPVHRDYVLSAAERKTFLMTCVSLGTSGDIELDL